MAKVVPLVMHTLFIIIVRNTRMEQCQGSDYKLILGDTHKMESESEVYNKK